MKYLIVDRPHSGIVLVTFNRPDIRNALSTPMLLEIRQLLCEAGDDDQTRCVVLTGNERAFSAGADITEMRDGGLQALTDPARAQAWRSIEQFPKPLIAAATKDREEGLKAFLEKREPRFTGE